MRATKTQKEGDKQNHHKANNKNKMKDTKF